MPDLAFAKTRAAQNIILAITNGVTAHPFVVERTSPQSPCRDIFLPGRGCPIRLSVAQRKARGSVLELSIRVRFSNQVARMLQYPGEMARTVASVEQRRAWSRGGRAMQLFRPMGLAVHRMENAIVEYMPD
jgi:hypothetical protein